MSFDLTDLRLLVAVADAGSISAGAARCHLALASASGRIKLLERRMGIQLLARGRRGVTPTVAGESVLAHARIVLRDVEALSGEAAAHARGLKAGVSLLANTASLSEHLPRALAAFLVAHPQFSVEVEEADSAGIARAVVAGRADVGLAIEAALPAGLLRFAFCDDHLVLVAPKGDPLLRRRRVVFSEVLARDVVGLPQGSALQAHLADQAARLGVAMRMRARLRDFDAICQMVAAGAGVAVVPEAAARRCGVRLPIGSVPLRESWAARRLAVCWRKETTLPRPARLLVEHLRAAAPLRSAHANA